MRVAWPMKDAGVQDGVVADDRPGADDRVRADRDVAAEDGGRIDHGGRMDPGRDGRRLLEEREHRDDGVAGLARPGSRSTPAGTWSTHSGDQDGARPCVRGSFLSRASWAIQVTWSGPAASTEPMPVMVRPASPWTWPLTAWAIWATV